MVYFVFSGVGLLCHGFVRLGSLALLGSLVGGRFGWFGYSRFGRSLLVGGWWLRWVFDPSRAWDG